MLFLSDVGNGVCFGEGIEYRWGGDAKAFSSIAPHHTSCTTWKQVETLSPRQIYTSEKSETRHGRGTRAEVKSKAPLYYCVTVPSIHSQRTA